MSNILKRKKIIKSKKGPGQQIQKYLGKSKNNLIKKNHNEILIYFNKLLKTIYYQFYLTDDLSQLRNLLRLIKFSCGYTLARKYKLKTLRKVFLRFGKHFGLIHNKKKITL